MQRNIRNWTGKITTRLDKCRIIRNSSCRCCIPVYNSSCPCCVLAYTHVHVAPRVLVACLPQCWYSLHNPTPLKRHWLQLLQMETLGSTVQRQVAQPESPAAPPPTFSSTTTTYVSCSLLGSLEWRPCLPVDLVCVNDAHA